MKPALVKNTLNGAHIYFGNPRSFIDCDYDQLEKVVLASKRVTSQYVWVDEWSDYGYKFPIKGEAKFLETYPIKLAAVEAWHAKNNTPPIARDWQQEPPCIVLDSLSALSEHWSSAYL